MWLKCILRGIVFPPTLGGIVWESRVPPDDVNKLSNRTEELSSLFPPYIHYICMCGGLRYDTSGCSWATVGVTILAHTT